MVFLWFSYGFKKDVTQKPSSKPSSKRQLAAFQAPEDRHAAEPGHPIGLGRVRRTDGARFEDPKKWCRWKEEKPRKTWEKCGKMMKTAGFIWFYGKRMGNSTDINWEMRRWWERRWQVLGRWEYFRFWWEDLMRLEWEYRWDHENIMGVSREEKPDLPWFTLSGWIFEDAKTCFFWVTRLPSIKHGWNIGPWRFVAGRVNGLGRWSTEKWWSSSMGFGWHSIYEMENYPNLWNHQPGYPLVI